MEAPAERTRSKRKSSSSDLTPSPASKKAKTASPSPTVEAAPSPMDGVKSDDLPEAPPTRGGFRGRGGRRGTRGGRGRGRGRPAAPTSEPAMPKPGRGRGGRVKQSSNARVQSLYHRKATLKANYKQLAQYQRDALEALAEKTIEMLRSSDRHKKEPAFDEVNKALENNYAERVAVLNARYEMHKSYLGKQLEENSEYERMQFTAKVDDLEEEYESWVKYRACDAYARMQSRRQLVMVYSEEEGHDRIEEILPRRRPSVGWAHVTEILPIPRPLHPADEWRRTGLAEAKATELLAELNMKGKSGRGRKPAPKTSPKKVALARKSTSLYQVAPQMLVPSILGPESSAPTAEGSLEPEQTSADADSTDADSGAEGHATDKYGVGLPNKPIPKNGEAPCNRFAAEPHINFETGEIFPGLRAVPTKANKNEPRGQQPKFYFDRICHGADSSTNGSESLSKRKVQNYGLHPVYGIPIKGCRNPSPERGNGRDWTAPLPEDRPIEYVTMIQGIEDELRPREFASRSHWRIATDRRWEQLGKIGRMGTALEAKGYRTAMTSPPRINAHLLKAVNTAQAAPPARQRSSYDPVRDIGYTAQPSSSSMYQPGVAIGRIADVAEESVRRAKNPPGPRRGTFNSAPTTKPTLSIPNSNDFARQTYSQNGQADHVRPAPVPMNGSIHTTSSGSNIPYPQVPRTQGPRPQAIPRSQDHAQPQAHIQPQGHTQLQGHIQPQGYGPPPQAYAPPHQPYGPPPPQNFVHSDAIYGPPAQSYNLAPQGPTNHAQFYHYNGPNPQQGGPAPAQYQNIMPAPVVTPAARRGRGPQRGTFLNATPSNMGQPHLQGPLRPQAAPNVQGPPPYQGALRFQGPPHSQGFPGPHLFQGPHPQGPPHPHGQRGPGGSGGGNINGTGMGTTNGTARQ